MIRECAYNFNASVFVTASAGVMPMTQSTPTSTTRRPRAIRLSGSPASDDASNDVKRRATLSVLVGVAHSLWTKPVDNLCILTPSSTFESDACDAVNALHCKAAFAAIRSCNITICIDVTIDPVSGITHRAFEFIVSHRITLQSLHHQQS